jgi:hypothetical protein
MKLVITIEIPTGADVTFDDAAPLPPGPEIPNEEIESLAASALPVQQIIAPYQPVTSTRQNPTCPTHHTSQFRPAGISRTKKNPDGTPKTFKAFWACPEKMPDDTFCKWTQDA